MPFVDLPSPPPAPQRTDEAEIFIERADAFVAWQAAFALALETFIGQLETAAALIAAAPDYADPGLRAMTGKTPAADRLIYFTGSASSALTTITALARTLLGAASAADAQSAIGISAWAQTLLDDADSVAARSTLGAASVGANNDIYSLLQSVTIVDSGSVNVTSIGYRGLPTNYRSAGYSVAIGDMGKMVPISTGGIAIPNTLPEGFACSLFNDSGSAQSVTVSDATLRFSGTSLTGARSLLPYGLASVVKVKSDTWVISGAIA